MSRSLMSPERLHHLVSRFPEGRIAVVGDFFLDKYLEVDPALEEPSVETGKPAHQVIDVRCSPGAAGTVVCNLAALGAGEIHAVGFVGDDGEGVDLRKALTDQGCRLDHLHLLPERFTPTYLKPRDCQGSTLEAEHPRYDTKNYEPLPEQMEARILTSLEVLVPHVDAVIILDQVEARNTGVITDTVRKGIEKLAQSHSSVVFWADSRHRILEFRHAILKPNQFELINKKNPTPGETVDPDKLRTKAEKLRKQNQAQLVITMAERGVLVSDPEWKLVPAVQIEGAIDPTGAGDSATAGAVLSLCAGANLEESALIGNLVASLTIQQIGTTGTARPEELAPRLVLWHDQRKGTENVGQEK